MVSLAGTSQNSVFWTSRVGGFNCFNCFLYSCFCFLNRHHSYFGWWFPNKLSIFSREVPSTTHQDASYASYASMCPPSRQRHSGCLGEGASPGPVGTGMGLLWITGSEPTKKKGTEHCKILAANSGQAGWKWETHLIIMHTLWQSNMAMKTMYIYIYMRVFPIWMPQKMIFQVVMFDYRVETHQLSCPTSWRGSAIL